MDSRRNSKFAKLNSWWIRSEDNGSIMNSRKKYWIRKKGGKFKALTYSVSLLSWKAKWLDLFSSTFLSMRGVEILIADWRGHKLPSLIGSNMINKIWLSKPRSQRTFYESRFALYDALYMSLFYCILSVEWSYIVRKKDRAVPKSEYRIL